MAERGVDNSEENPFSFKTFVNVKDKKVTENTENKDIFSDDEEDNIFGIAKKEKSKQGFLELLFNLKPAKKSKSNAQKCHEYRENLKLDAVKYAEVLKKNNERIKRWRSQPVTEEELARRRELARLRSKKYRDAKKATNKRKAGTSAPCVTSTRKPKVTTGTALTSQREKWRTAKRLQREKWGPQQKRRHQEKSLDNYHKRRESSLKVTPCCETTSNLKRTRQFDVSSEAQSPEVLTTPIKTPPMQPKNFPVSAKTVVKKYTQKEEKSVKKAKPKENPFSFKKFLAGSSATSSSSTTNSGKNKATNLASLPPLAKAEDNDLPSLHHDHFSKEASTSKPSLPDLGSNSFSIFNDIVDHKDNDDMHLDVPATESSKNSAFERVPENGSPLKLSLFNDNSGSTFQRNQRSALDQASGAGPLQLPDFLSDGPLHSSKHNSLSFVPDEDKRDQDLLSQIRILQEENNQLHSEVSRLKQKCSDKNQRLSQLKNDMERLKKKEAEETAVMEKAVQQVEENLVTTTKRAVQAETTVSKLKQEVKSLQNQVRSLNNENEAYRQGDGGLSDIRERTKYTSDKLKSAAGKAESNLKELMSGVDQLRLLSEVLASWEKITDVNPDQEPSPASDDKQQPSSSSSSS